MSICLYFNIFVCNNFYCIRTLSKGYNLNCVEVFSFFFMFNHHATFISFQTKVIKIGIEIQIFIHYKTLSKIHIPRCNILYFSHRNFVYLLVWKQKKSSFYILCSIITTSRTTTDYKTVAEQLTSVFSWQTVRLPINSYAVAITLFSKRVTSFECL